MRKYLLGLCLFILMAPITAQKDAGSAKTIAMDKEMFMERIVNYQANPGEWNYLGRSEEHTSELRYNPDTSYAVFCLK